MLKKILAVASFVSLAVFGAAQSKTLIINQVLINVPGGNDDGQGLELFEIKNTGNSAVDLTGVALVILDNQFGENAELDGYYKFSGTLAANSTLVIQDKKGNGAAGPALFAGAGTTVNGVVVSYEFFSTPASKNATSTDLSNSGANYILVDGFQDSLFSSLTFGLSKLDSNGDGILDFLSTPSTADDLWTNPLDAVCVYPDTDYYGSGSQEEYISGLGLSAEHAIICQATAEDSWTPDYIFRMYRETALGKVYDRWLQGDVLATSGNYVFDHSELTWDDGTVITLTDFKSVTGVPASTFPTLYPMVARTGNFTNWALFGYLQKGTFAYRH